MPGDDSTTSSMLTSSRVLSAVILLLLGAAGFLIVRYVDGYIPKMIETEVSKQVQADVKTQIAEEIKNNISSQIQSSKEELLRKIDENNKYFNDKIIGIYEIVSQKPQTLAPSLKRGTRRNHATLMKTLPIARELLAHARSKALSMPQEAPVVTQWDFNEISRNLFINYKDPALRDESWNTLLELASYKTVMNGIKFGVPKPSRNSDDVLSLNDRELKNAVIVDKVVLLGQCGVNLRNVRFVNCRFEVDRGINGEKLLQTLLESNQPSISLRLPSPPGSAKGACDK